MRQRTNFDYILWYCFIVADIRRLITHGLDDEKLANFCRVLSVTISDLDIYENKSSCKFYDQLTSQAQWNKMFSKLIEFCDSLLFITALYIFTVYAQNKQKRSKGFINVRDINQGWCYLTSSLPGIVVKE